LSTITSQCNKAKLMLACRPVATPDTLTLLAWAPRADVLFDTGTGNVPHLANGSSWYFNGSSSWGFAPAGAVIDRYTCDVAGGNPGWGPPYDAPPYTLDSTSPGRLCWHTGGQFINTGWRCGAAVWLNSDPNWVRVVYQAD
ncbi:MAG TPA: hypothetical protein VFM53_05665, partial [Anaeromyxobacteraceae bacterium]|nr:hypothetical protein [Anaeromyxobacteraceae bacterium]